MRTTTLFLCAAIAALTATGCKKKGTGGGGGWFVGDEGLMANVDEEGERGTGYEPGAAAALNAIACRYLDEAWVVGNDGTLLYTNDAGGSWSMHDLGTTAHLRGLATQDAGPVFVAGDGVFFTSVPEYKSGRAEWTQLGDGTARFVSVAAAQRGTTVLAISDDGGIWSYEDGALVRRGDVAGARAIAIAPDGAIAYVAGDSLAKSLDGGLTWSRVEANGELHDVRVDERGEALAVGAGGLVVRVDGEGRVLSQRVGSATLRTLHVTPSGEYSGIGYAGGDGGVTWMTLDDGWTWIEGPNLGRTVLGVDEIGEGHN